MSQAAKRDLDQWSEDPQDHEPGRDLDLVLVLGRARIILGGRHSWCIKVEGFLAVKT